MADKPGIKPSETPKPRSQSSANGATTTPPVVKKKNTGDDLLSTARPDKA